MKAILIQSALKEHIELFPLFRSAIQKGVLVYFIDSPDAAVDYVKDIPPDDVVYVDKSIATLQQAGALSWITAPYQVDKPSAPQLLPFISKVPSSKAPIIPKGMYPSAIGTVDNKIVCLQEGSYTVIDVPNCFGNFTKRSIYQSYLAKYIIERMKLTWLPVYQKVIALFIADFKRKKEMSEQHSTYFKKIARVLHKQGYVAEADLHNLDELQHALEQHLKQTNDINIISDFLYQAWWPETYGYGSFEPLLMTEAPDELNKVYEQLQPVGLFSRHVPRPRVDSSLTSTTESRVAGIVPDQDYRLVPALQACGHFSTKSKYNANMTHPIAQLFKREGRAFIGGPSGTWARICFMLYPLWKSGELTDQEYQTYLKTAAAYLVYHGHHSYEEIEFMADGCLDSIDPSLDPVRTPDEYFNQFAL